jgi:serine/threonine protein kinase
MIFMGAKEATTGLGWQGMPYGCFPVGDTAEKSLPWGGMGPETPDPAGDEAAFPEAAGEREASGVYARVCPTCGSRFPPNFRVCPHDATPLEDGTGSEVDDPLLGQVLAESYELVRVIGEGGMGRVYEARHTRLRNKRYAIKIMLEEFASQSELVARFQREAEAASHLSHNNVVAVYDVHRTDDGRPYIVEELLEGEELGNVLAEAGKLDPERAVRIARQVCLGLAAAHDRGIVHRDMKPENVYLVGDEDDPVAKVLDFGISKLADNRETLTKTGMVIGTPAYMAPEQASGMHVDHRADIYAVGAILYRAIGGRKPFEGMDAAATLTALLTQDPPRLRTLEPRVPEGLEMIVQRAMTREVDDRYQSMIDLEADLREYDPMGALPSAPSKAAPPTGTFAHPDPSARTMLAEGDVGTRISATSREVRFARPMIVLFTALGYLWLVGGVTALVIDGVRWSRGHRAYPDEMAILLIALGTVLTTATPLYLWIRHLGDRVWSNSVKCVDTARRVGRIVGVAIATYGIGTLALHVMETSVWRRPNSIFRPEWYVYLFAASILTGALTWAVGQFLRRKPAR